MSSKLIKPHTPTPQNLKNYKLSYIDELVDPGEYFAVVLFYESKPEDGSLQLEESLARILVDFYPLAGRFINNYSSIDCCDEGAELVEAEALDVELIELVAKMELDQLDNLLPDQHEAPDIPILSIQITRFSCGGAAVAISVSHKIFDGSSLATFVAAWTDATNPDHAKRVICPSFHLPSLLPSVIRNDNPAPAPAPGSGHKLALKRLSFNKEALTSLKSRISRTNGKPLSGARVVSAVLAEAQFRLDRAKHGRSRSCVVYQTANMRERSIPPQPRHTCGNFWALTMTPPTDEVDVNQLVRVLGDSIRDAIARHAEILSPDCNDGHDMYTNIIENYFRHMCDPEITALSISDWSRFGFHEADFGWGKPVSTSNRFWKATNNFVVLMSDKSGDGIEACGLVEGVVAVDAAAGSNGLLGVAAPLGYGGGQLFLLDLENWCRDEGFADLEISPYARGSRFNLGAALMLWWLAAASRRWKMEIQGKGRRWKMEDGR
ncbi:pelargonidin 3-O-(6-caffeoylglucoside) 5-O-(6-O-malonylglucoside) 4'''-malonyltransferase-like [Salvia miltiorrhiza]|uniref:pelargonidin 3-O-(6-caffeoylglucoside) 5-O-(6-O-malonylglucoside) 4'''-malonyltransferase-like n=1 Tax=Salvia miltiorrhiza TaxID=226208 RepID=UPI0025AD1D80|nr:pelargonidin 3-O-(6-caffeoylglucoside) 5-O-(6-O-malonylglucoside) 4'''-malonyltransferase-like [Salvia miltiorrhiza]